MSVLHRVRHLRSGAEAMSLTLSLNKSNSLSAADKSTLSSGSVYKPALRHKHAAKNKDAAKIWHNTRECSCVQIRDDLGGVSSGGHCGVVTILCLRCSNQNYRDKEAVFWSPDEPVSNQVSSQELPVVELWRLETILPRLIAIIIIMIIITAAREHVRGLVDGCCWKSKKKKKKHLVMTGKEHRLPRAVLFFSPHSSMCQSHSSFFRKRKIEITGVICGAVVAPKCQRQVVSQDCSPRWNINTALSADLSAF